MPPRKRRASRARAENVGARDGDERSRQSAVRAPYGVERRTIALSRGDGDGDGDGDGVACVDGACVARCVDGAVTVGGYALAASRATAEEVVVRSAAGMASATTCAASGGGGATLEFRAVRGGGAYAVCGAREARALGWTPTMVSRDWERALTRVREAATRTREAFAAAFVGPKGVGKSTLARHAANVILRERGVCGWLDLDCGQPELTAPGMVSLTILRAPLLGPPQTHQASGAEFEGAPSAPLYASFVGDVSPQGDPDAYVEGALACVDAWAALGEDKPALVVNASGWVKGLGLELAEEILRAVGRSTESCYVININSHVASRNVPDDVYWFHDANVPETSNPRVTTYEVAAGFGTAPKGADAETEETSVETYENIANDASPGGTKSKDTKRSPSDSRALSWLAWSRQTVAMCNERPHEGALELDDLGENEAFAATAFDLTTATPWRVSFDDITLHVLQSDLDAREALMALNGAVVGLLKSAAPGRYCAECVGVGVVRGIDVDNRYVYILTPVSSEKLKSVTTLALGTLEFPPRLLGHAGEYPYMQVGAIANEGSGSKAIKSRNNILRQNTAPTRR